MEIPNARKYLIIVLISFSISGLSKDAPLAVAAGAKGASGANKPSAPAIGLHVDYWLSS